MRKIWIVFLYGVISPGITVLGQEKYELSGAWKCRPAVDVKAVPEQLSMGTYTIRDWMPAVVPGTVLTTLLENKKIPDPFFGMNNNLIPDLYHVGADYYTYWFCRDFTESKPANGRQVWLNFRGINYGCDVYLNGQKLNKERFKGMFLRQRYNITALLSESGKNRLAVVVYPPDHPGNPNGGQGGDGTIAREVAHQYVAGWDWIQPIRDRNTGIWDKVTIEKTGNIAILDPHIVTEVPGVRLPDAKQAPAIVHVAARLQNTAGHPVKGVLEYVIDGQGLRRQVTLAAHADTIVSLPMLEMKNPKLWWPNTYGPQNLYGLQLRFLENGVTVSDRQDIQVGIRQMQHRWNAHTRSMEVLVNGQPIFVRGGNWIISDAMLRFSKERYDAEIRFHRDMRLNLIRVWGGAITERPEFYEACDKYGLLVMQDFWGSGDCNGRWQDPMKTDDQWVRRQYPDDHGLFIRSAADMIKMVRNYPSLAIWCGGNEITLAPDLQHALKDSLMPLLDGTRWFIDYSNSDSMSYNALGGNGDGPYGIQDIKTFWAHRTWPFNSEVGSVGVGDAVSLKRFLPEQNQVVPEEKQGSEAVSDSVWTYHKYIGYGHSLLPYGGAKNMEDFANKAQLVNYDQYRALMEGFTAHQWDWYTGVIIWKTQNPWTALRGQMYDYYLDPNACLYGLRAAGETLHPMWNPADSTVQIANNGFVTQRDFMLVVKTYDMRGKDSLLTQVISEAVPQNTKKIMSIAGYLRGLAQKEGLFLVLQLKDLQQKNISENICWLAGANGVYSGLQHLPASQLKITTKVIAPGKIQAVLTNPAGAPVAFFNRLSVVDRKSGERLLPSFYSDNYVTVLPGEEKTIEIDYPKTAGSVPAIRISGWNMSESTAIL